MMPQEDGALKGKEMSSCRPHLPMMGNVSTYMRVSFFVFHNGHVFL